MIKRNGFSLIELMVVFAIIGILAAAVFPAIEELKGKELKDLKAAKSISITIGKPTPEKKQYENISLIGQRDIDGLAVRVLCVEGHKFAVFGYNQKPTGIQIFEKDDYDDVVVPVICYE